MVDDYHCDYDGSVLAMITSLVAKKRGHSKEHPAVFLLGSRGFYAKIRAAGAHMCLPSEKTYGLAGVEWLYWNRGINSRIGVQSSKPLWKTIHVYCVVF